MVTLVKLGGSLITDKTTPRSYRDSVVSQLAQELKQFYATLNGEGLIIGHGSGSFGHVIAKQHKTIEGVKTSTEWVGFAEVGNTASELNHLVMQTLMKHQLPIWRIQPSASVVAQSGEIVSMAMEPIAHAVEHQLIPLVYGDVAIDLQLGGTIISTETLFFYLAKHLPVSRIILMGEVDGVLDENGDVIPEITLGNYAKISDLLGGSRGTDVTGGMRTKVEGMLQLARQCPKLQIHIINGKVPNTLLQLANNIPVGTLIHHNS